MANSASPQPARTGPAVETRHGATPAATPLEAVESLIWRLATGPRLDRLGAIVGEHLATGGKRLRAKLALGACDAVGPGLQPASSSTMPASSTTTFRMATPSVADTPLPGPCTVCPKR